MVWIPPVADQYQNVDKLVRAGVGIRMLPSEVREDSLRKAVVVVLTNESYHQRAVTRSKQFRNQPQPPLDWALFWIEQVLEHKGLQHLRSPPTPLYQQYGLAVAVAPFVILAL
ncbi:UDP-glucosyltransferase 2-like [Culex pipiens pallens]|uniref:UDP-glucosyltransferase 2-like n=1 Tax=Culex pipiens pallens TaxID=42434 RepID=UPI001952B511|nr:UDP-glucosyltransferase 2-like [Culex pipiens pallens]